MGKDELISKLSTFIRNENYAKIDEIIKKFREESNYEMICFSSQAFINMSEYKEALEILDSIKKEYSKNAEFCARYAIALFHSEKEDKSLQWFEKAKEKGLEDLSEISNDFFSKSIDDWIKKAKFWGPIRVEENSYKEEL